MITFVDVTDRVNIERALKEKNEALQKADQLKNDFVQHVSYELRSPLTNIIGFTELLSLPATGPLQPRQREYVEHIGSSSSVLLTIVNDILDLATVDAGIMELDIAEVDVKKTIAAAGELIADRLAEHSIALKVETAFAPESHPRRRDPHPADPLQSALQRGELCARRQHRSSSPAGGLEIGTEFSVHDDGPGHAAGSARHGVPPLRAAQQWRPAARRRARPVDRQELRRAAWRQRPHRDGAGPGHDRDLPVPDQPRRMRAAAE